MRLPVPLKKPFDERIALPAQWLSHTAFFWTLQCSGWLAYGLAIAASTGRQEPFKVAILDSALFVFSGFVVTSALRYLFRVLRRRGSSLFNLGLSILVAALVGMPAMWELDAFLTHQLPPAYIRLIVALPAYSHISFPDWMTWNYCLIGWCALYFGINSWISLQAARHRAFLAEVAAHEARALVLQAQLQPHFLFNTLNSVSALILDHRGEEAAQMIADLGSLLRMSIHSAESPLIPLAQEMDFIRQYLELEKMRFGNRLNYRFAVSATAATALVPTFLLQPLVENALRHGILPQRVGGLIEITGAIHDRMVKLQVADNGGGWQTHPADSSGIGLANTARRLRELFGSLGHLDIVRGAAGGVRIDISFPFEAVPTARQRA